jgi:hypothetical protein
VLRRTDQHYQDVDKHNLLTGHGARAAFQIHLCFFFMQQYSILGRSFEGKTVDLIFLMETSTGENRPAALKGSSKISHSIVDGPSVDVIPAGRAAAPPAAAPSLPQAAAPLTAAIPAILRLPHM